MGHWTPSIKLHHISEILHSPEPKACAQLMGLHVKGVCKWVQARVREFPHVHMWMCDSKAATSRMCVYQRCCQRLDSPFTIRCLNQLSKCRRSHRSPSCREDIGIWEVSSPHHRRTHPDCTKWICSSPVGNSDQCPMNFGSFVFLLCLLLALISVIYFLHP